MPWGLLIDPRGSPWRPWAAVTEVVPAQGPWFDPARLLDPQPRCWMRLRCDVDGAAAVAFDLGAPAEVLTHAALIATTIAGGTLRLRGSSSDSTGAAGEAFDVAVPAGALAEPGSGSIAVALSPDGPAQYLRVDVSGQVPEAWIDIGLIVAGAAVLPARQYAFGSSLGRIDFSRRDVSAETGAGFGRAGPTARQWEFEVPHPRAETMWGGGDSLTDRLRRCRAAQHDVLVIPDVADAPAAMSRRAVWGALEPVGGDVIQMFDVTRLRWRVTERI